MTTATWNRGRDARTPTEMPATGWKDTLMRVKKEMGEDNLTMISAAMAFYALLAFVPALTSVVLIYAWISDPAEITQHISQVSSVLPKEMQEILKDQLTALTSKADSTLGLGAIASLGFSLWSASKGTSSLIDALNIIYDEKNERGFFKKTFVAIGFALLGALMVILAIGLIVGIPAVFSFVGLDETMKTVITLASWLALLALFSLYLAFSYRYAPDRKKAQWKWVSPGAVFASVVWVIASGLFSWYATEFGSYNKTYGSMGAIIVLMMWFYITSFVVLLGGEINAELEHQTKKDTTTGSPKPMGSRQATMADHLGESYEGKKPHRA